MREEKCLFNYEFFNVFAKVEKLQDDIQLKGKILDKEYAWKINKDSINDTNVDLEVLFAKQEMDRLEEYIRNTYDDEKIENYKKMIIELSEKYNVNSKYTSFITVYERKDKLLDVPKYQETKLSNKFAKDALMNAECDMVGMDEIEEVPCCNTDMDMDIPTFLRKNTSSGSKAFYRPDFLRNEKIGKAETEQIEVKKKNREILEEKVNEYYQEFSSQKEKSILTFLLYSIYYLRKKKNNFNYNDLLRFLRNHKQELLESELYLKLLYVCYKQLEDNRFLDKKETMELMDENFKKIAVTNLKISVEFKELSENEIKTIVENDKVVENIDKAIEHLIAINNSLISWMR